LEVPGRASPAQSWMGWLIEQSDSFHPPWHNAYSALITPILSLNLLLKIRDFSASLQFDPQALVRARKFKRLSVRGSRARIDLEKGCHVEDRDGERGVGG
jgi:hypothetical protein